MERVPEIISLNMSKQHQNIINGLELRGSKAKGIALLIVLLFIIPSVYAGDCPANKPYPVTCKCDNGQIESHYDKDSFLKARDDPDSCCYYKAVIEDSKVFNIRNDYEPMNLIKAPNSSTYEAPTPILTNNIPIKIDVRADLIRNDTEELENEVSLDNKRRFRYSVQAFFRFLLPELSRISNPLFS